MRFRELVTELDLNPATAFSKGFDRGSEVVDKIMSPSKWGQASGGSKLSSTKSSSSRLALEMDQFELKDAKAIMSAVIKGNVSALSDQEIQTARKFLERLNDL